MKINEKTGEFELEDCDLQLLLSHRDKHFGEAKEEPKLIPERKPHWAEKVAKNFHWVLYGMVAIVVIPSMIKMI